MTKQYLDPKMPLDIEPAADRGFEKMTECCLDINGKSACIVKGRGGGAWWMIWMIVACIAPAVYLPPFSAEPAGTYAASLGFAAITTIGFGISLYVWPVRVWRKQLPLRFSRKTRKVYFNFRGKTYIEDWDTLKAYLTIQRGVVATGAPIREAQINLEFHDDNGRPFTVFLMGVDNVFIEADDEAAVFWEYIRRYMEESPENLPEPDMRLWRPAERKDLLKLHWPFPIIRSKNWWWWPFDLFLFFPIRTIWFSISYPTEVLYYHLAKHIKVVPFPPEMDEPCQCASNDDAPPIANETRR